LDGLHTKVEKVAPPALHSPKEVLPQLLAGTERALEAQHDTQEKRREEQAMQARQGNRTFHYLFLIFLGIGLGTICCMFRSLRGIRIRRSLGLAKRKQSKSTIDLTRLAGAPLAPLPPNSGFGLGHTLSHYSPFGSAPPSRTTPSKKTQWKDEKAGVVVGGYEAFSSGVRARTTSLDYDEISRLWDSPGSEVVGVSSEFGGTDGVRPRTISYDYDADRV
jgi:hypothetical protein